MEELDFADSFELWDNVRCSLGMSARLSKPGLGRQEQGMFHVKSVGSGQASIKESRDPCVRSPPVI